MARKLREKGFDARALLGGYNAWRSEYPVEPKSKPDMAFATKVDGE